MPRFVRRSPSRVIATLLVGAAVLAGVVVAGPGVTPTTTATADDGAAKPAKRLTAGCRETPVRLGMVLPADDADGRRASEAIADEIGRQVGCRVSVVTRETQPEMLAALALHQIDVAQVDPATLVVGERTVALTVMGAYSAVADTAARASAPPRLWAPRSGPVRSIEDTGGRRITLGPALTAAGDLAPRAALLAAGVPTTPALDRVADTATEVTRGDDDRAALARLRDGATDVALTRGPVTEAQSRGLRAVWTGEPPLADLLVIRPGVPNDVRRLLLSAVRDVPGALLAPLAARQGIDSPTPLMPVPTELYDPVADQLDTLTAAGLLP
ncbi:MAG: PhnD/SsuA/transferrin family substrate-binding protein [Patulibacter sp.]|nr:PhnD/SsuA/transferrin family substrate-binding protein [Patulibacter sp.]